MSEFVDFCGVCGIALTHQEVSAHLECNVVFFIDKSMGTLQITLCGDCKNKIWSIAQEGLDKAISRRLSLDGQEPKGFTKKARAKWDRRDKDDEDGGGGVRPVHPL